MNNILLTFFCLINLRVPINIGLVICSLGYLKKALLF